MKPDSISAARVQQAQAIYRQLDDLLANDDHERVVGEKGGGSNAIYVAPRVAGTKDWTPFEGKRLKQSRAALDGMQNLVDLIKANPLLIHQPGMASATEAMERWINSWSANPDHPLQVGDLRPVAASLLTQTAVALDGKGTPSDPVGKGKKAASILDAREAKKFVETRAHLRTIGQLVRENDLLMADKATAAAVAQLDDIVYNDDRTSLAVEEMRSVFQALVAGFRRGDDALLDHPSIDAAVLELESMYVYNDKATEFDASGALTSIRKLVGAAAEIEARSALAKSLPPDPGVTHTRLAERVFGQNNVAAQLDLNATIANKGAAGLQGIATPSPLQRTLARLELVYPRLYQTSADPEHRHANELVHQHLFKNPLLWDRFDSTGFIGAAMAQVPVHQRDLFGQMTKIVNATPPDLQSFQKLCAETVEIQERQRITLMELERELLALVEESGSKLTAAERTLLLDASAAIGELGDQLFEAGSPYRDLYNFAKQATASDADARSLLNEARAQRGLPA